MYAQRFGSLPIAHRTGGLADTIEDGVTGFLFREMSLAGFVGAIKRGLDAFRSQGQLSAMRKAAMGRPHGWSQAAKKYQAVYSQIMQAPAT
jgi:starch synthase